MAQLSDSFLQDEQKFFEPMVNPEHSARTYAYGYQYRIDLPEYIFCAYLYSIVTGKSAFILNKRYYNDGFELRAVNVAWQPIFEFHMQVMAGLWEPAEGEEFIRRYWTWQECRTHFLPPPNARWIIPLFN